MPQKIHSTALGMQASIRVEHRKSYEKLEGKAIYNHPPVNQPRPHDTHRITHSKHHWRTTMYIFMASVSYNDWSTGSPIETSGFDWQQWQTNFSFHKSGRTPPTQSSP